MAVDRERGRRERLAQTLAELGNDEALRHGERVLTDVTRAASFLRHHGDRDAGSR